MKNDGIESGEADDNDPDVVAGMELLRKIRENEGQVPDIPRRTSDAPKSR